MSKLRNRSSAATTTPIHKEISERGLLLPTEPDFKGNFQVASAAAALTITMRSVVIIIIMLKWREKWEHVHDNLEMEGGRKEELFLLKWRRKSNMRKGGFGWGREGEPDWEVRLSQSSAETEDEDDKKGRKMEWAGDSNSNSVNDKKIPMRYFRPFSRFPSLLNSISF